MLIAPKFSLHASQKRVLVIAPPYRLMQSNFPLGSMYIAAVLQEAGHRVEVIDMDVLNLPKQKYIRELQEREYDYVCIGGMITAWNFIFLTCDIVRRLKPFVKIIVGGGLVSSTPRSFISVSQADAGVVGEGEEAVIDLIDAFENGRPLSGVDGIVFREGDKVIQTQKRQFIRSLDSLPFPAWDLFSIGEFYVRYASKSLFHSTRQANIYTTRGCPFQCTFCYTEKKVRQRSIANVMEEIGELKRRYDVKHIHLNDDLFVVRKNYAIEFAEALIRQNMKITWSATGRCNIVTKDFVKILRRAGCVNMGLGIESGSMRVLKLMKKSQTPEQIVNAVKLVSRAGIRPGGTFILGMPPETRETIRETVALYKRINAYRKHVNRFFYATPYPGTELYDQMVAKGKIQDEIKYFEKLSKWGDAVEFCVNCTDALSDGELIRTKQEIEAEVFKDFMRKHPLHALRHFIERHTPWAKLRTILLKFKFDGFWEGMFFSFRQLLIAFKLMKPEPKRKLSYGSVKESYGVYQTLFE